MFYLSSLLPPLLTVDLSASAGGTTDRAGISYERIAAEDGVFGPFPNSGHAGTQRLFETTFSTKDGRARFHQVEHRGPVESPSRDFAMTDHWSNQPISKTETA